MASENPTWRYTCIRGARWNLRHDLERNTIRRILVDAGLEPAPERGKRTQWATFLKAHWGAIAEADFFTVEVVTNVGLVRYFVLVVMDLKTRRVHIAGIAHQMYGKWMEQVARSLTDPVAGFPRSTRHLIPDRDPRFTAGFAEIFRAARVVMRLGEAHLRNIVTEYVEQYHRERSHQGLDNELIDQSNSGRQTVGAIKCRERLGGTLRHYRCEAA